MIDIQFHRISRGWPNVIEVDLVGLQIVLEEIVPLEDCVLIGIHETGTRLYIKPAIFFLDRLQLTCGVNGDIPRTWLLPNLLMLRFQTINAQCDGDVQVRTFLQNPGDIGKNPFVNLPIGHYVDRLELVVLIKRTGDLRQILARERLSAGKDQYTQIAAERFGYLFNLMSLHLELLARPIVQLLREKAMSAAHITDRSHKDIEQHGREGLADRQFCVTF